MVQNESCVESATTEIFRRLAIRTLQLAYVVKYVTEMYNRSRMLHSPTCGGSVVETVAVLPRFKKAKNKDDEDVCTFVMTDHVCREMAVRDDISRHDTSAADAKATQSVMKHVRGHRICSFTFTSEPKRAYFFQRT
jgi:hypothetical protein